LTGRTRGLTDLDVADGCGDPGRAEDPMRPGDTEGPGDQGEARVPED